VQIQRPLKKDERNSINMTTTVGKHGLKKETAGKMFVGAYRLFAHPMNMITTVGKYLLGNKDR